MLPVHAGLGFREQGLQGDSHGNAPQNRPQELRPAHTPLPRFAQSRGYTRTDCGGQRIRVVGHGVQDRNAACEPRFGASTLSCQRKPIWDVVRDG